ncbi:hypothetical protein PR202_ga23640 [Eleusine coracana subsp. coracana]|uniref:RING-type E3 ubiquitin transferase n=1 Tax=Eleusine coracana subsp. coracana TaxID=191504 RepID=A0AAV5D6U8_ELECO|nr:hypothetical protein PR202_ga23640 [Eleusine coracana subsp. coracana]
MYKNPFDQFRSNWLVRNGLEMSAGNSKKRQGEPHQEVGEDDGHRKRKSGAATSVTVELDVLDCPVCLDPLRPPIFQCSVGHIICSTCRQKLINPKKCHYCSSKSDFNRCYGIEKIVESIQVPCSNAKYGCAEKTIYYEKEYHEKECPLAPCFCPEMGCSFAGSTQLLLEHFIADHNWRFTKVTYGWSFHVDVQEGVHVLSNEDGHLFLLNVVLEPFGCVVSAFCVQPQDTEPKFRCSLTFSFWKNDLFNSQSSEFELPSTTLSDGIPSDRFLFIVPKSYLEEDNKISVTVKKSLKSLISSVSTDGSAGTGIPS